MVKITIQLGLGLVTLMFIAHLVFAANHEEPTLSDREAAHRLLTAQQALKLSAQVIDGLFDSYRAALPNVPETVWLDLRAEFDTSELAPAMEEIYMRYFTADELDDISDFFESPLGKLYIESQPSMLTESMAAGKVWAEGINKRLRDKLKHKKLITPT